MIKWLWVLLFLFNHSIVISSEINDCDKFTSDPYDLQNDLIQNEQIDEPIPSCLNMIMKF